VLPTTRRLPSLVREPPTGKDWPIEYNENSFTFFKFLLYLIFPHANIFIKEFLSFNKQDSYMLDEFKSQADGMLSQDSTYQGDRAYYQSQPLSQGPNFSQY